MATKVKVEAWSSSYIVELSHDEIIQLRLSSGARVTRHDMKQIKLNRKQSEALNRGHKKLLAAKLAGE